MKDIPKAKLKTFAKALDDMQSAFDDEVAKLAEKVRAEILPYFKKHNFDFGAVNGSWIISRPSAVTAPYYRPDDHVEDDDLPPHILALLRLEVGYNNRLGDHIRPIKRGEW